MPRRDPAHAKANGLHNKSHDKKDKYDTEKPYSLPVSDKKEKQQAGKSQTDLSGTQPLKKPGLAVQNFDFTPKCGWQIMTPGFVLNPYHLTEQS